LFGGYVGSGLVLSGTSMLARVGLLAAICVAPVWPLEAQGPAADAIRYVEHQGVGREFILYRPAAAIAAGAAPLVVVLHGLGVSAHDTRNWGYEPIADREGLIVAYPRGIEGRWSYGRPVSRLQMPRVGEEQADDIGFLARLLDTLVAEQLADRSRLFVVGLSNGALMAYAAACAMTRRFAAVAALLSPMTDLQIEDCKPEGAIPIMVLAGTHDRSMPYGGAKLQSGSLVSIQDTIGHWRQVNSCDGFQIRPVPHRSSDDLTRLMVMHWATCADGVEIVSYRVEGGGHHAPSLAPASDAAREWEQKAGARNRDIDTAEEVWSFFRRFSRR
jgi:polyhydroxybutyrate depolymerase